MSYTPPPHKQLFHSSRQLLARVWMGTLQPLQLAVTGSQGKTSVRTVLSQVLRHIGETIVTDLNLDTVYNVPQTALKVRPSTKFVLWELGVDHPGNMDEYLTIAKPQIAIITGLSPVHTDAEHMGSFENLIAEKRKLVEHLPQNSYAILNYDDKLVRAFTRHTKAKVIFYGKHQKDLPQGVEFVSYSNVELTKEGTTFTLHDGADSLSIKTPLIGLHHASNLAACYAAYKLACHISHMGISKDFATYVQELEPLRGRMNLEPGPLGTTLLNDSLRANPESTRAGLETLANFSWSEGRKIAVIGEMGELENPEAEHKKTGEYLAAHNFEFTLCIGPLRKFTIDEATKLGLDQTKIGYAKDVFEAANKLKTVLKPGDLMYLKGSLLRNYKRIIQLLNNEPVCCHEVLCPYEHCGYRT